VLCSANSAIWCYIVLFRIYVVLELDFSTIYSFFFYCHYVKYCQNSITDVFDEIVNNNNKNIMHYLVLILSTNALIFIRFIYIYISFKLS